MNCSDREGPTEDPDSKGKLTNRRENDCVGLSASFVRDSFPEMAKRSSIFTVSSSGFLYLYKNRTLTFSSLLLSNFPFFPFSSSSSTSLQIPGFSSCFFRAISVICDFLLPIGCLKCSLVLLFFFLLDLWKTFSVFEGMLES